jgi:hypothetical protein
MYSAVESPDEIKLSEYIAVTRVEAAPNTQCLIAYTSNTTVPT